VKLADVVLEELRSTARVLDLGDGDVLVHEGDAADEVFYLRSGRLTVWASSEVGLVKVGTVDEGQVVGEITVVAGGRRTATLRADGEAVVLGIPRAVFEDFLGRHEELADEIAQQARERMDRSLVASMVSVLLGVTETDLIQEIVDRIAWRRLDAGDVLFERGDYSDSAYFIVSGRLLVLIESDDGNEEMVRELGKGEVVGELGLIDRAPRSATVRAVRDTTVGGFSEDLFQELVDRFPSLMLHVARGIIGRLRRPPRRLIDRAASITVAVVAPVPSGPIVEGIIDEMRRHASVTHLSSARVDDVLNREDIAQVTTENVGVPRLAEFMHEAYVANDHVVLETDPEMTPWTRRAMRQADRAVLVVSSRPDSAELARLDAVIDALDGIGHVRRMLAVLHTAGELRPEGTATLLARSGADEAVHLRAGSADDLARLARLASGNGVGIVFSGGGARGFAHLGAYRALRECGVPIDRVGGCSMGAPMAGGVALGLDYDDLVDLAERQFHGLLDYTLPIVSLLKGKRITRNIEAQFGTWDIEDLWVPFYCVSTNLTTSSLEVHRRGPASTAIRASVAIPGVLPPVPYHGDLLVDGGVLNNLPVQAMRTDGTIGTVVAIDVAPSTGPRAHTDFGLSVSGWSALGAKVRRRRGYPSVTAVLLRSMLAGAVQNQRDVMRNEMVDLLVSMRLPGIGLLEFERTKEVAAQGYEAAKPVIVEWSASRPWQGRAR
jgi:predicted acylesterase/phospholipase RssA/CRP-like cAMP-binding protein